VPPGFVLHSCSYLGTPVVAVGSVQQQIEPRREAKKYHLNDQLATKVRS